MKFHKVTGFTTFLILLVACTPPNNVEHSWSVVEREVIGEGKRLYGGPVIDGETKYFTFIENIRHGHGYGENFTLWQRDRGESEWSQRPLFQDHHPGMSSLLPLDEDDFLFLYVDRTVEANRRVHLVRVTNDEKTTLLEVGQERERGNPGVLNPRMDLMEDDLLHVLIPDRTDTFVRRFIIDPETGEQNRLSDIETPRAGARIYGRLMEDDRLLVPLAVIEELLLLVIDLTDHSYEIHSLDTFTTKSNEPPRNMSMYRLEDPDQYAIAYFRPAEFSDRSGREGEPTGLVGQKVLMTLDVNTLEPIESTVLGGFSPEKALTHTVPRTQIGPRDFLFAFTTVDRIHVRHLTGRYENYTGASMSRWRIQEDGVAVKVAEKPISPIYSASLVTLEDGNVLFSYMEADPDASRIIELISLNEMIEAEPFRNKK